MIGSKIVKVAAESQIEAEELAHELWDLEGADTMVIDETIKVSK